MLLRRKEIVVGVLVVAFIVVEIVIGNDDLNRPVPRNIGRRHNALRPVPVAFRLVMGGLADSAAYLLPERDADYCKEQESGKEKRREMKGSKGSTENRARAGRHQN